MRQQQSGPCSPPTPPQTHKSAGTVPMSRGVACELRASLCHHSCPSTVSNSRTWRGKAQGAGVGRRRVRDGNTCEWQHRAPPPPPGLWASGASLECAGRHRHEALRPYAAGRASYTAYDIAHVVVGERDAAQRRGDARRRHRARRPQSRHAPRGLPRRRRCVARPPAVVVVRTRDFVVVAVAVASPLPAGASRGSSLQLFPMIGTHVLRLLW